MNELYKKIILVLAGGLVAISAFLVTTIQPKDVAPLGGAPPGFTATTASTSAITVSTTATAMIATTTNCISRIITTRETGIYLTLGNEAGQTPVVGGLGHYQATTTQTVYDAATFGCGLWKTISSAATVVTLTEFTSFR